MSIREELPPLGELAAGRPVLLVCDANTERIARKIRGDLPAPLWTLLPGEAGKNWAAVEDILRAARQGGLGRDGLFIGAGGGVVSDLTAFAASVYMRGASLALLPTTLLGMADAALGGKTGFDLFGIKNLAGTFYPAEDIYICRESLASLPGGEWKSGMAEILKTAIIAGGDFFSLVQSLAGECRGRPWGDRALGARLMECVSRSVEVKGRLVEADPRETGDERALLNLGHTFGHALESALGLGRISHGEAVAWGTVRSCELGLALGITPPERAGAISALFKSFGYETGAPHPLLGEAGAFTEALGADKKRRGGKLRFIVPDKQGAAVVELAEAEERLPGLLALGKGL